MQQHLASKHLLLSLMFAFALLSFASADWIIPPAVGDLLPSGFSSSLTGWGSPWGCLYTDYSGSGINPTRNACGYNSVGGLSGLVSNYASYNEQWGNYAYYSQVSAVNATNFQAGPWFLTCPSDPTTEPNPTDDFYFYPTENKNTFIGGDRCLASATPLLTTVWLPIDFNWGDFIVVPVSSSVLPLRLPVISTNIAPGRLWLSNIVYSPEVDGELSNGFSTNSYIFGAVPSYGQHDLWTWNTELADLSKVKLYPGKLNTSNLGYGALPLFLPLCVLDYQYSFSATIDNLQNLQIDFTEITGGSWSQPTINHFETWFYPYLLYNFSITQPNSYKLTNPNMTGFSYDIFSPWNYYTPQNSIDMMPLDLQPSVLANYTCGPNNYHIAAPFPSNGFGINTSQAQTEEDMANFVPCKIKECTESSSNMPPLLCGPSDPLYYCWIG